MLIRLEAIKKLVDQKMNIKTEITEDYWSGLRVHKIINPKTQENYCMLFADVEIIHKDGKRFIDLEGAINGVVYINNQPLTPNEIQLLIKINEGECL